MKKGFTLMELLLVVAILLVVMMLFLINIKGQINKGNDARRKTDLEKIQKSFEEYYNDNHTYPAYSPLGNCGGSDLAPYLTKVPCDPTTHIPYKFIPGEPSPSDGYIVCARLQDTSDPAIKQLGCDPVQGCGWGVGYNYCVSSGSVVTAAGAFSGGSNNPGGGNASTGGGSNNGGSNNGGSNNGGSNNGGQNNTPTPTQVPNPGVWACTPDGSCNAYSDPTCDGGGACCPHTYQAFGCTVDGVNQCTDPSNRCTRY